MGPCSRRTRAPNPRVFRPCARSCPVLPLTLASFAPTPHENPWPSLGAARLRCVGLALQIAEDRAWVHAQIPGSLGAVAVVALEHLENVAALKVFPGLG